MLLKRGMIGPDIGTLVDDLIKVGFAPNSGPGNNFNADVEKAVRAFQSTHIGPNLIPLVIDGKVGPLTRFALDVALGKLPTPSVPSQTLPNVNAKPAASSQAGWNALQTAKQELATLFRRPGCEKVAPAGQFGAGGRVPVTCLS